jgi:hypothetical protein
MIEVVVLRQRFLGQTNTDLCKSSLSSDTHLWDVMNTSHKQKENDDAVHDQCF